MSIAKKDIINKNIDKNENNKQKIINSIKITTINNNKDEKIEETKDNSIKLINDNTKNENVGIKNNYINNKDLNQNETKTKVKKIISKFLINNEEKNFKLKNNNNDKNYNTKQNSIQSLDTKKNSNKERVLIITEKNSSSSFNSDFSSIIRKGDEFIKDLNDNKNKLDNKEKSEILHLYSNKTLIENLIPNKEENKNPTNNKEFNQDSFYIVINL